MKQMIHPDCYTSLKHIDLEEYDTNYELLHPPPDPPAIGATEEETLAFQLIDKQWLETFSKLRVECIVFLLVRRFMPVKAVAVAALTNIKRGINPREPIAVFMDRFARVAGYTEYSATELMALMWDKIWPPGIGATLHRMGGMQGVSDYQNRPGGAADEPLPVELKQLAIVHPELRLPREVPIVKFQPAFIRYLTAREESVDASSNSQLGIVQALEERLQRAERTIKEQQKAMRGGGGAPPAARRKRQPNQQQAAYPREAYKPREVAAPRNLP